MENRYTYEFIIKPGGDLTDIRLKNEARGATVVTASEDLTSTGGHLSLHHSRPSGFLVTGETRKPVDVKQIQRGSGGYGFHTNPYDGESELVIHQDVAVSLAEDAIGSQYVAHDIAVDSFGGVYITGCARTMDYPLEDGLEIQSTAEEDVFVTKLDPSGNSVIYTMYIGGTARDHGKGISVDSNGSAYITGVTNSDDFPIRNALFDSASGGFDAFVAKVDPSGDKLVYSTYLGGSSDESGQSLAVDPSGAVCMTGWTQSSDFPVQGAIFGRWSGRRDVFVLKIHPTGRSLVFSTYLGGTSLDFGKDVSLGRSGTIWVTGYTGSEDFPVHNAITPRLSGKLDVFVTQLSSEGDELVFSTFLGGSSNDIGNAISDESKGSVFVTGYTGSENFPLNKALDEILSGRVDAFVTEIDTSEKTMVFSTYLGGASKDSGCDITVDSSGSAYLTGYSYSDDFPTHNALSERLAGDRDAFVIKMYPTGLGIAFSTFLGGGSSECGKGIAVDRWGAALVTGQTCSRDFPAGNSACPFLSGEGAAFVTKFSSAGSTVVYSSCLGAVRRISTSGQTSKMP